MSRKFPSVPSRAWVPWVLLHRCLSTGRSPAWRWHLLPQHVCATFHFVLFWLTVVVPLAMSDLSLSDITRHFTRSSVWGPTGLPYFTSSTGVPVTSCINSLRCGESLPSPALPLPFIFTSAVVCQMLCLFVSFSTVL